MVHIRIRIEYRTNIIRALNSNIIVRNLFSPPEYLQFFCYDYIMFRENHFLT